ncbi:GmrSD restriction endonuclease domain-containing protein [Planococcus citreus]|uniref:GmrSD restriction endonuclease domain-containing protein n=1 Tax=Planococcus citreus TaxID=1373 RepID=UPI001081C2B1|nr:DUF262 domain-containing protein [Planococcus citreus]
MEKQLLDYESEENELVNLSRNNDIEVIYPHAEIKVERDQYPIFQLYRKFKKDQIVLDPDFQRGGDVWNPRQKSELIESVLMGIPLPIFYLNESKEGKLIVVDGRQRLTTFFSFLNNEFRLKNLRILEDLNNLYFADLDSKHQANFEDFQIIAQIIKPPTPDRIKFDIFDRVNRGGTPLNNQEMRNALYQGKSTVLLKEIAENPNFIKATQNSIQSKRMKDKYLILRAIAFNQWNFNLLVDANGHQIEYKNDIDEFLGKTMEYLNNCSNEEIKLIKKNFINSMICNHIIMNEEAFRRLKVNGRRQPINMILFEALTSLMSGWEVEDCQRNKEVIKKKITFLLENDELNKLLTIDRGRGLVVPAIFEW